MSVKARWDQAMAPNYGTPGLKLARGHGAHVWDSDGNQYVDLLAGIAVNILGHAHPAVVAAVAEQMGQLAHTSNLYANEPSLRLAERLQTLSGGHKALFCNSGTEANEAALKLVRRHAHNKGTPGAVIVAFRGSFHGRTTGALALTGKPAIQEGFTPLPNQIVHVNPHDPAELEQVFETHDVAGMFVEPVLGEGGIVPLQAEYAATAQRLCDAHDALLVTDEVQTGIGRTGSFFGYEQIGLRPDAITLAKGLGGGLPIGACLIDPVHADLLGPGSHGCTFGGNAIAAAAANAVLDTVESEGLVARAARLGRALGAELDAADVTWRGRGLLVGLPLVRPDAGKAVADLQAAGYLAGVAGPSVVRLAPPLIIDEDDLLGAVPTLAKVLVDHVHPVHAEVPLEPVLAR